MAITLAVWGNMEIEAALSLILFPALVGCGRKYPTRNYFLFLPQPTCTGEQRVTKIIKSQDTVYANVALVVFSSVYD